MNAWTEQLYQLAKDFSQQEPESTASAAFAVACKIGSCLCQSIDNLAASVDAHREQSVSNNQAVREQLARGRYGV